MLHVQIPEGVSGDYRIEQFTISQENFRAVWRDGIPCGTYTRLLGGGRLLMSDTPQEYRDHVLFIHRARGHVLINGLGLGMVIAAIQDRANVQSIMVNEISEDVIKLVGPTYEKHPKVTINHADAYTWKPTNGQKFDAIWHDVWGDVSTDQLAEMTKLSRRYARWLAPGGFQDCWKKSFLRYKKRQEQRRRW